MVFSSLPFLLGFLPLFFAIYYVCPNRQRNIILFVGSLVFYALGVKNTPFAFLLLVCSLTVNVLLGNAIARSRRSGFWFAVGLLYNFGALFFFKYSDFVCRTVNEITGLDLAESVCRIVNRLTGLKLAWRQPTLPPGISFFTFQAVSYLIDLRRGRKYKAQAGLRVGTYLCMFPQLIAGPIITYDEVEDQLRSRNHSLALFDAGLREFCIGLGMKVLLANRVGMLWNQVNAIGYDSISTPLAWMGIAAFSFQLYFDFYGYSRMASGLGMMLGMKFPRNFQYPYMSCSMTEFWRRWHITLGRWFREYVYIPLGGSRCSTARMLLNLLAVWLLTGVWHGADWNFLLWGGIVFALIALEKLGLKNVLDRRPAVGHLYMLLAIPLTWLVFAVTDLRKLGIYLKRLFPFFGSPQSMFAKDYIKYGKMFGPLLAVCLLFSSPLPRRLYQRYGRTLPGTLLLLAVFWLSVYCLYIGLNNPFLYFRF